MRLNKIAAALLVVGALMGGAGVAHAVTPQSNTTDVAAFGTDTYRVWANAGDRVTVMVRGDGDTDVDLYVFGGSGLIASDTDSTDQCVVVFRALTSGYFEIRIKNLGSVYNHYTVSVF